MFQRYGDPVKMIEQMSWSQIPRFIRNLVRETQEEQIERIWFAKDIEKGLEDYRRDQWRRVGSGKQGKADKKQENKLKQMEQKVRLRELDIEDLEL